MLRKLVLAMLAATAFQAAPAFAASPVDGTWATAIDVQGMKIEADVTFAEAAGGYTVTIKDGPMPGAPANAGPMPSEISDVKVDGPKFSFNRKLTTPQGVMNLAYAGSVEGNALIAQVNSEFGPIAMTGTRK